MRYPEISGWQRGQVTSRIWQRYLVGSSTDPADWPTRLYCLAPLFITRPYKSMAWAAACRVRFTGKKQSVGPSRSEDDSWAQSAVKLSIYPRLTLLEPGVP